MKIFISALILTVATVFSLVSCSDVEISVSDDGYLVVNGEKTDVLLEKEEPKHEHSFGDWHLINKDSDNCEDMVYYHTCTDCGHVELEEGSADDHSYISAGSFTHHRQVCEKCDSVIGEGMHRLDANGTCADCGVTVPATDGVVYEISADGTYCTVIDYIGNDTQVCIATEYEGLPVKEIGYVAFEGNYKITDVIVPDGVTYIDIYAFSGCKFLEHIVIPESVIDVGFNAFFNCDSLEYKEYKKCKYLGNANNPYHILMRGIGEYLTYHIHEDTKVIAGGAFGSNEILEEIVIPDGVVTIGGSVFSGWFYGAALVRITIPNSVTLIREWAIYSSLLTDVYYTGSAEEWAEIVIEEDGNEYLLNANIHYNYMP